jgi:hypothetical protein
LDVLVEVTPVAVSVSVMMAPGTTPPLSATQAPSWR